jgi:hypothetical protein
MKFTKPAQLLIDRYIAAFSKRLPFKGRKETAEEVRSSMYDELEAAHGDNEIDEQVVKQFLLEWGAPGKLASNYSEASYLISPGMFPLFKLVFSIAALVTGITAVVSIIYHASTAGAFEALIEIPKFISGLAAALGFTVGIFYLIEHFNPGMDWKSELYGDWKPEDLPEIEDPKKVRTGEQIVGIFFLLLLILGTTLTGRRIGAYYPENGSITFIPVLQDGFFSFLPFLVIRWILSIVLASVLLYKKRETLYTNVSAMFLNCTDIAIAIVFLRMGEKYFFNFNALLDSPLAEVLPIFKALFIGIMVVAIAASAFEIFKRVRRIMISSQE